LSSLLRPRLIPHPDLEESPAEEIVAWAAEQFGDGLAMSSSFQGQSLPLLHLVSRVAPRTPVVFLDTGFHFPETLAFRDRIVKAWGLNLVVARHQPDPGEDAYARMDLHRQDPDLCCHIHKVEPMRRAMEGRSAWLSGVRRDQGPTRASLRVVETASEGMVRVHPMAAWTDRDVWRYVHEHGLPDHPLTAQGYLSVGCAPCTQPVQIGADPRSGRWPGQQKTECGLHTTLRSGAGG
jgi:phosphoadenosine phosphosulfate reductase